MSQSVSQTRSAAATQESPDAADTALSSLHFDLNQPLTAAALDGNATALMDSLFADVNRMLERDGVLPIEPSPEQLELNGADDTAGLDATLEVLLSSQFASLAPKLAPRDLMPSFELEPQPEVTVAPSAPASLASQPEARSSLWLVALCGSLLLSLGLLSFLYRTQVSGLWLSLLEKYRPAPIAADGTSAVQSPSAEQPTEHADFLDYLKRALERLSNHAELPPALPSTVLPSTISPTANASPSLSPSPVERVYVPIYPTAVSPSPVQISPVPIAPVPQRAVRPVSPVRSSPQTSAVPNIEAATDQTLIGVLELGERSAALFEVNGIPKRIEIGEQLGSSGWTLVSIRNQEAIVRRNGEVRSIYVGQKF